MITTEHSHVVLSKMEQVRKVGDEQRVRRVNLNDLKRCIDTPNQQHIGLLPPRIISGVELAKTFGS